MVENAINALKRLLEGLIDDENHLKQLGIIVDADYQEKNGLGFDETFNRIKSIAADYAFNVLENNHHGFIFQYQDSEIKFGVWIMPNNNDEGMLEDFIKTCVKPKDPLFNHAINVVKNLPKRECGERRFIDLHLSKAEVATWLAWQNPPGHGFYATMTDNLLHTEHEVFLELQNWLKQVFA